MVDTVRTTAALLALFADNTTGDISAQDLRDMIVSVHGVYGGMYFSDNSSTDSFSSTFAVVTRFDTAMPADSGTTIDVVTDNDIVVGVDGDYLIHASASMKDPSVASIFEFAVHVDGSEETTIKWQDYADSAADNAETGGGSGIVSLTSGQAIDLRVKVTSGTPTATIVHGRLLVLKVA